MAARSHFRHVSHDDVGEEASWLIGIAWLIYLWKALHCAVLFCPDLHCFAFVFSVLLGCGFWRAAIAGMDGTASNTLCVVYWISCKCRVDRH